VATRPSAGSPFFLDLNYVEAAKSLQIFKNVRPLCYAVSIPTTKGNQMTISFPVSKISTPDWAGFDDHLLECNCQWCDPEFHLEMGMEWENAFELEPPF